MLHAVVMAGGAGTRFWPASRIDRPKQLLDFGLGKTLLQSAVGRLEGIIPPENAWIITNRRLVEPIRTQLPSFPPAAVLGEPCKRDTAPCIGLAAALILARDPEGIMLVTPADHVISTDAQFHAAVKHAVGLVESDPRRIITFGIKPTYPAATFGYIERDRERRIAESPPTFAVVRFREKPSVETAREYVASGEFSWNAGIFTMRADTIWNALREYEPEMFAHLDAIRAAIDTPAWERALETEFAAIRGKSIDFAVMERYQHVVVVEAPFAWDDLGNWPALARTRGADAAGNTVIGEHLGVRTSGCVIRSEGEHLIATLGVNDLIIVHTADATLVANKYDEEAVREIVKQLEARRDDRRL